MPCHALHALQHTSASPFGLLNHRNDFPSPSCRSRLYITDTGISRYAGLCLELPTPRWIADQGLRAPSTLDIATQIQLTAVQTYIRHLIGALVPADKAPNNVVV